MGRLVPIRRLRASADVDDAPSGVESSRRTSVVRDARASAHRRPAQDGPGLWMLTK